MSRTGRAGEAQAMIRPAAELGGSFPALFRELTRAFRARGVPAEEASDLAQETIVRTLVHLKRHGQTEADVRPLVVKIAKNLYRDRGRRYRPSFVTLGEAEELPDHSSQPSEYATAEEARSEIREAIAELPPRHRRVIALYMRGLGPAEIARELGIKRNAADALLHRIRRRLAATLEPGRISLGILGALGFRIRGAARRVATWASEFDPSGSIAHATTGLAAVGMVAVMTITAPAARVPRSDSASTPAVEASRQARIMPDSVPPVVVGGTERQEIASVSGPARQRDPEVGVFADTGPGDDDDVGVWIREDDREDPGVVGPVVYDALQRVCAKGPQACEEISVP